MKMVMLLPFDCIVKFTRLFHATTSSVDPLAEITDEKAFVLLEFRQFAPLLQIASQIPDQNIQAVINFPQFQESN